MKVQKTWYAKISITGEGNLSVFPDTNAGFHDSIGNPNWKHGYCHQEPENKRIYWRCADSINHRIANGVAWQYLNSILDAHSEIPF